MVHDLSIGLNTEEGTNTYMTEVISGNIAALIIKAEASTQIKIESELGYCLFKKPDCFGTIYSFKDQED